MKKFLSCSKVAVALLIVTVLTLCAYTYMLARPISYGMSYHFETVYEGETFEGPMKFAPDGTVTIRNTNFIEEMQYRYYYKDGYVFSLTAKTDEAYEQEVAYINENFDEVFEDPFYSAKINALRQAALGPDGYAVSYVCSAAVILAVVGGVIELVLIALFASSLVLSKKAKRD